jgi:hypothetical protein
MTIERTGLAQRERIRTTREISTHTEQTVTRTIEASGLDVCGYEASAADRVHFLQMLLASGFADLIAQRVADAIVRELFGSLMRPLPPNQPYLPPFYCEPTARLDPHLLERFFGALGVDPALAFGSAHWFADEVDPGRFYQPLWRGVGGTGELDLARLRELIRGRGLEHSGDVSAHRLRNQMRVRPGGQRRAQPSDPRRSLLTSENATRRFDVEPRRTPRRTDPGADLLRHRANSVDQTRATRDATALRDAMEGWGTDEARLISVLSNRSNAEVREIARAYQQMYGESLEERISSETSGDLRTSLLSLLRGERSETSRVEPVGVNRDVTAIRTAVEGWGTDEEALIRVLTGRSTAEIGEIARVYEETYGESLRSRIESETSGDLRTTLLAQLDRRDGTEQRATIAPTQRTPEGADRNAATRTATALREAMEGMGTDEEALIRNLVGKSNAEIREIKAAYQQMYGESLEERVSSETSGDFRTVLMGILSANRSEAPVADPVAATRDATALRTAMQGWGTDEDALARILTNRSPAELRAIAQAYQRMYGENLRGRVDSETSGDFCRSLLALLDHAG